MREKLPEIGTKKVVQGQLKIHKVYLKDASFETSSLLVENPEQKWQPHIDVNIDTNSRKIKHGDHCYEVVLHVLITARQDGKTAFLVELQQAGIFTISGLESKQVQAVINAQCPDILFPFVREAVNNLVAKGGFPQLLLGPVNFETLYRQKIEGLKAQKTSQTTH